MTVSELASKLTDAMLNGKLKGNEPVFDAAFFGVDGFTIYKGVDDKVCVLFESNELLAAQGRFNDYAGV